MEACANFEECAKLSIHFEIASCRARYAGEQFKQCTLARPIHANQSKHLTRFHIKGHIIQRPECVGFKCLSLGTQRWIEQPACCALVFAALNQYDIFC